MRGGGTEGCASQVRGEAAHLPEQESGAKRSGARGKRDDCNQHECWLRSGLTSPPPTCAAAARKGALHRCAAKPRTSPSRKAERSEAVRGTSETTATSMNAGCVVALRRRRRHARRRHGRVRFTGARRSEAKRCEGQTCGGGMTTCASHVRGESRAPPRAGKRSGARDKHYSSPGVRMIL